MIGLWILTAGTEFGGAIQRFASPLLMAAMVASANWVAFWADLGGCSGSVSLPFLAESADLPSGCGLGFGYGALALDSILAGLLLSKWLERRPELPYR